MSGPTPLLPLFPLPNVVHFPGTLLPLHIFEPRYRAMVRDLLDLPEPERLVGMLLSGGPPEPGEGAQTLVLPGTAGRLVGVEPLADGRFDILLHGEFRFEIAEEVGGKPYRRARVRPLPEGGPAAESLREGLLREGRTIEWHIDGAEHGGGHADLPGRGNPLRNCVRWHEDMLKHRRTLS